MLQMHKRGFSRKVVIQVEVSVDLLLGDLLLLLFVSSSDFL